MLPSVPPQLSPHPAPVRRRPPVPALVAAPLAVLSALTVGLFLLLAWTLSGGHFNGAGWVFVLAAWAIILGLLVGAVLLVLGRSWLVLALPAAGVATLILAGQVAVSWGDGMPGPALLYAVVPAATAVLAARPGVRRWVAARRRARKRTVGSPSAAGPRAGV